MKRTVNKAVEQFLFFLFLFFIIVFIQLVSRT